jgi:adenylate kinase
VGTGDILREAVRQNTPAGRQAKSYVDSGQLVPDALVNDIIYERFHREDRPDRFVMDGYPRTLAQAAAFDQVLRQVFLGLDAVVLLRVQDEEIVRRLSGRWSCPAPGCKATYHVVSKPPRVAGRCDDCGTELIQRADDREDTVRARLRVYHTNTVDLIPYYQGQGLLREVSGQGTIEEVHASIMKVLKYQAGPPC